MSSSSNSSSSNSSRSSSAFASRATTPSSELSSDGTTVCIRVQDLCANTLRQLFCRYGAPLSLVVERGDVLLGAQWESQGGDDNVPRHYTGKPITVSRQLARLYNSTTKEQADELDVIASAGLRSMFSSNISATASMHVLEQPSFVFPPTHTLEAYSPVHASSSSCRGNIPSLEEWRTLWKAWDLITLQMIPQSMLLQKPIDLRHKCLFYIGHIPTFVDMLLSKSIGGAATEPAYFWNIFERGIDPHVDDPDHCHNHSEVPENDEDWPTIQSIISFRDGVRARLIRLYEDLDSGKQVLNRNIARTLVMTFEHEGWHIETLLYMLIQRAGTGTLPPPGFQSPDWAALAEQWRHVPAPSTPSTIVGPADLTLGHHDSEADDAGLYSVDEIVNHTFGWDNESPSRRVHVGKFRANWRPITNSEYEAFCSETKRGVVPKSWIQEDGQNQVRTFHGAVPMSVAGDWPVLASYDELADYARSKGGRLPTEAELRLFLNTYDVGHAGGSNVGFRHWHPVPATMGLDEMEGKGSNGGVWEWTSTLFDNHDGLVPTNIFSGYSSDFFDEKHHVVLGASYATIPRLADRKTVRNFYQHNYPYPWASARVVHDL